MVTVGGIEPPSPGSRPVSLPLMYTEKYKKLGAVDGNRTRLNLIDSQVL